MQQKVTAIYIEYKVKSSLEGNYSIHDLLPSVFFVVKVVREPRKVSKFLGSEDYLSSPIVYLCLVKILHEAGQNTSPPIGSCCVIHLPKRLEWNLQSTTN